MTKRLTQAQIKHISDLYYDYEIYELQNNYKRT